MVAVPGRSEDDLERRAGRLAARLRRAWRAVARSLLDRTIGRTVTLADLGPLPALWATQVERDVIGYVGATLLDAADDVRAAVDAGAEFALGDDLVERYLAAATNRLRGVGDEVWRDVRVELLTGVALGEDVRSLAARVRHATGFSDARALVVARTEVHAALEAGSYEQARLVDARAKKTWLATNDGRTRETHRVADGQVREVSDAFAVGGSSLRFPGDPEAPPGETVNCRCSVAYEFDLGTAPSEAVEAVTAAGDWNPKEHPRGNDGKFIDKDNPLLNVLTDDLTGAPAGLHIAEATQADWDILKPEQKQKIKSAVGAENLTAKIAQLEAKSKTAPAEVPAPKMTKPKPEKSLDLLDVLEGKNNTLGGFIDAVATLDQDVWDTLTSHEQTVLKQKADIVGGDVKTKINTLAQGAPTSVKPVKPQASVTPVKPAEIYKDHADGHVVAVTKAGSTITWDAGQKKYVFTSFTESHPPHAVSKKDAYDEVKTGNWFVPSGLSAPSPPPQATTVPGPTATTAPFDDVEGSLDAEQLLAQFDQGLVTVDQLNVQLAKIGALPSVHPDVLSANMSPAQGVNYVNDLTNEEWHVLPFEDRTFLKYLVNHQTLDAVDFDVVNAKLGITTFEKLGPTKTMIDVTHGPEDEIDWFELISDLESVTPESVVAVTDDGSLRLVWGGPHSELLEVWKLQKTGSLAGSWYVVDDVSILDENFGETLGAITGQHAETAGTSWLKPTAAPSVPSVPFVPSVPSVPFDPLVTAEGTPNWDGITHAASTGKLVPGQVFAKVGDTLKIEYLGWPNFVIKKQTLSGWITQGYPSADKLPDSASKFADLADWVGVPTGTHDPIDAPPSPLAAPAVTAPATADVSNVTKHTANIIKNKFSFHSTHWSNKPEKIWDTLQKTKTIPNVNLTDAQILAVLDALSNTQKSDTPWSDKIVKWLGTPKGKAYAETHGAPPSPLVAPVTPTPAVPVTPLPAKTAKVPNTPVGALSLGTGDTSHLTDPQKLKLYGDFKKQPATFLTSSGADLWAAAHGIGSDNGLSTLQVLRVIDEVGAAKVKKPDEHLFEKKIVDWLQTPKGHAVATGQPIPKPPTPKYAAGVQPETQLQSFAESSQHTYRAMSAVAAKAFWDAALAAHGSPWTGQQSASVRAYTGGIYHSINAYLYGQLDDVDSTNAKHLKQVQLAMRPSTQPVLLHRGTGLNQLGVTSHAQLEKLVGQVRVNEGFSSTSVGGKAAFSDKPVILEIEAPPGTPMAWAKPVSYWSNENEMLLGAGTHFKILSVAKVGARSIVRLRVVPPPGEGLVAGTVRF